MIQKIVWLLLAVNISLAEATHIDLKEYKVLKKQYKQNEILHLVTRSFVKNGSKYYFVIDTKTLKTDILPFEDIDKKLKPISKELFQTPFGKLLETATSQVETGGLQRQTSNAQKALYLSMDMCPSLKEGYENKILEQILTLQKRLPIGIAITEKWVENHEKEFVKLAQNPNLDITWINHSKTHFYDKTLPLSENFLLHVGTKLKEEILDVEKMLLGKGLIPSVFFRFPGLIADENLMKELRETYFLIPLGADAWIAKEQKPKEGSIILIHGNKNEPKGISMLSPMLPELLQRFNIEPLLRAFVE
ncbi:MAG: hypothetical protein PHN38_07445 [Sulfurospirillaceae bacterium]|nr:hypothetical protein [Sulfurospirillaceae bacterium]